MRPDSWRRLGNVVLAMGALAGGVAVYEAIAPTTWLHFLTNVIDVPRYQAVVFHHATSADSLVIHSTVGGHSFVRVGSILQSPLALGFYLCVALAIGLERLTQSRLRGWSALATLLSAAGIVATVTRSALLAGLVVILVLAWRGIRHLSPGRVRLGLILVGIAIVIAPFAGSSAVGERTAASTSGGEDASTHVQAVQAGFDAIIAQPFGRGLGTAPGIGQRFQVHGTLTSEDAYLQVGNELGIIAMVLFVLLLLSLVSHLRRAPPNGVVAPTALFAAGCGLIVGGLFLHVWLDFPTSLTFWGIAGVALNPSLRSAVVPAVPLHPHSTVRRYPVAAAP
jgi:O-antigen ligase